MQCPSSLLPDELDDGGLAAFIPTVQHEGDNASVSIRRRIFSFLSILVRRIPSAQGTKPVSVGKREESWTPGGPHRPHWFCNYHHAETV